MSFLDRFRKKQEDEASRIARLSKTGRMADGHIIDAMSSADGTITQVTYTYILAGTQFESTQHRRIPLLFELCALYFELCY
jgi:hypothetical protein